MFLHIFSGYCVTKCLCITRANTTLLLRYRHALHVGSDISFHQICDHTLVATWPYFAHLFSASLLLQDARDLSSAPSQVLNNAPELVDKVTAVSGGKVAKPSPTTLPELGAD